MFFSLLLENIFILGDVSLKVMGIQKGKKYSNSRSLKIFTTILRMRF
jgi:hypothetical protein